MAQRIVAGGALLLLLMSLAACGPSGTSLTAQQLQEQNPEAKYVNLDGVSLHYTQEGLGKPLVFLHGFLTNSYLWRNITPGLTYGKTIYSLDLMGSGISEKPQNQTYSIETHVAQLSKFISDFHLDNVILAGHGIGGSIAAVYTVRNPQNVRKLVLMNTPLYPGYSATGLGLLKIPLIGGLLTNDWFLERTLRGGVAKPDKFSDFLVKTYLQPYQNDPGARVALLKQVKELNLDTVLEKEVVPALSTWQVPTFLMWGDGDPYVPLDEGKRAKKDIPDAKIYVVLNTAHYSIEERPEDVRQALKEFLDQK
ncbi:MAG: alpha/beta fold hydrolase [Candidatus Binatia bacterium]